MAERHLIPGDPELWRRTGHAVPACTADACRQGRGACPCPAECRLPERDDDRPGQGAGTLIWPAVVLVSLIASAAVVL